MSTPVYYLKISVKIQNKMTVCKPQRKALMSGSRISQLPVSRLFFPPSLHPSHSGRPMQNMLANVRRERNRRSARQRWRRRRGRQEEKEGHVFSFCSHYSSQAGRYPGRQCSSAEVRWEGYQWVAGERLQHSSVTHGLRRRTKREGCGSLVPVWQVWLTSLAQYVGE